MTGAGSAANCWALGESQTPRTQKDAKTRRDSDPQRTRPAPRLTSSMEDGAGSGHPFTS